MKLPSLSNLFKSNGTIKLENIHKGLEASRKSTAEIRELTSKITQQQAFIDQILNTTPTLIYTYDLINTCVIWSNNKIEDFAGYTPSDIKDMGKDLLKTTMHPDDYVTYLKIESDIYNKLEDGVTHEHSYRYKHKIKDEWIYLQSKVVIFKRDSEGNPIEILGSMEDVTAKTVMTTNLRLKSEALDAAANGIIITDIDGKIIFANNSFIESTGYEISELVGQNPRILKSGKHSLGFYEDMWSTLLSGKVWKGKIINKTKSGEFSRSFTTITPIFNGKINYFIAIKERI